MSKVLIVDDKIAEMEPMVQAIQKALNCEVMTAEDGVSGLQKAEEDPPDIILLDVLMPKMNGFEMCRKLKENEQLEPIPVIFITGQNSQSEIVKGFEIGGVDYVTKPFLFQVLVARIRTHLKLYHTTRDLRNALAEVKQLEGMLNICSYCKNMKNEDGKWVQMEDYISHHSDAEMTHGICPACFAREMKRLDEN